MSATAGFRRQHDELETAAFELLTHLVLRRENRELYPLVDPLDPE